MQTKAKIRAVEQKVQKKVTSMRTKARIRAFEKKAQKNDVWTEVD